MSYGNFWRKIVTFARKIFSSIGGLLFPLSGEMDDTREGREVRDWG